MKESYRNPASKRENIFENTYNNPGFKGVLKKDKPLPKFPFLIDLEITNHCNLKCVFCAQQLMSRKKGYMSDDVFKKVIDECDRHKTPVRLIRWGEPFMHPNIMSFIEYVKTTKTIPIHVTTNGLCLNKENIKQLVDLELDSIIFSFQGATEEEYGIMRGNERYGELKDNILELVKTRGKREKPFIQITTTVTDEPETEIENFIDYWGSIADFVSIGKTNLARMAILQDKSKKKVKNIERLINKETNERTHISCREVYQKLSANYTGSVSACCGDFDDYMIVGDLSTNTLEDIWNKSSSLKAFRVLLDNMQHDSLSLCRACFPAHRRLYRDA